MITKLFKQANIFSATLISLILLRAVPSSEASGNTTARIHFGQGQNKPSTVRSLSPEHIAKLVKPLATMTEAGAQRLEAKLGQEPDNVELHFQLLFYAYVWDHSRDKSIQGRFQREAFWMIEHFPDAPDPIPALIACLSEVAEPDSYAVAKKLWLNQLIKPHISARILSNAAHFLSVGELPEIERLMLQAASKDPQNPEWLLQQGNIYAEFVSGWIKPLPIENPQRLNLARKALIAYKAAYKLTHDQVQQRQLLKQMAEMSLQCLQPAQAQQFASRLLKLAIPAGKPSVSNDVAEADLLLGRCAMASGNIDKAKRFLLSAAHTQNWSAIRFFGPDMTLATALLAKNERTVVLEFLQICNRTLNHPGYQEWIEKLKAGETPDLTQPYELPDLHFSTPPHEQPPTHKQKGDIVL